MKLGAILIVAFFVNCKAEPRKFLVETADIEEITKKMENAANEDYGVQFEEEEIENTEKITTIASESVDTKNIAALQPVPVLDCPALNTYLFGTRPQRVPRRPVSDWQTCRDMCRNSDCLYWTWKHISGSQGGNRCWLMQGYIAALPDPDMMYISGDKNCTHP